MNDFVFFKHCIYVIVYKIKIIVCITFTHLIKYRNYVIFYKINRFKSFIKNIQFDL